MKQRTVTIAKDLKVSDIIFLNDFESLKKYGTYYVECYSKLEPIVRLESLQSAQILENSRVSNNSELAHIRARTDDERIIEFECSLLQKISQYIPEKIAVSKLAPGDTILLRGDYNPAKYTSRVVYALIELKFGYKSKVLSIRKTLFGKYRVKVRFGGVKKLGLTVDSTIYFELAYEPGSLVNSELEI